MCAGGWFLLFLAVWAGTSESLEGVTGNSPASVMNVDEGSLDSLLAATEFVFVQFYVPWCGHCQRLQKDFQTVAGEMAAPSLAFARVDCAAHRDVAARFSIREYPALRLFRDGKEDLAFSGERSPDGMKQFLLRATLPVVKTFDSMDDLENEVEEIAGSVVFVGHLSTYDSDEFSVLKEVATAMRDCCVFAATTNPSLASGLQAGPSPAFVAFKDGVSRRAVPYVGPWRVDEMKDWVLQNSLPLLVELGPHNYHTLSAAPLPLAMVFANDADASVANDAADEAKRVTRAAALEFDGAAAVVFVCARKYLAQLHKVGLSGDVLPAFAVDDHTKGVHFAMPETTPFTEGAVFEFLSAVLNGTVEPTIKSAAAPAENAGPITVVVASQFTDLVLRSPDPVLLSIQAPWCGHCKMVAPVLAEVAEAVGAPAGGVRVATLDAAANDLPRGQEVAGYPTIRLYRGGAAEDYEGARTAKAILRWLEEQKVWSPSKERTAHDEL